MENINLGGISSPPRYSPRRDQVMSRIAHDVQRYVANHSSERSVPALDRQIIDQFLGVVTFVPPIWSSRMMDYTDARYFITRQVPNPAGANYEPAGTAWSPIKTTDDPLIDNGNAGASILPSVTTATNLAELVPSWKHDGSFAGRGSHLLQEGNVVEVRGYPDPANPTKIWYVFSQKPTGYFKITGNAPASGVYTAVNCVGTQTVFDPTVAGAFTMDQLFPAGSTQCYVANRYEANKSGSEASQWDLTVGGTGTVVQADLVSEAPDGKWVFLTNTVNPRNCS